MLIVDLILVVRDFTPSSQANKWRQCYYKDGSYLVSSTDFFLLTHDFSSDRYVSLVS